MAKLFVGGLAWATTDDSLRQAFEEFEVEDAVVLKDRETGRSRGFGFVTVAQSKAEDAIAKWDNQELDGRRIRVQAAAAREGDDRRSSGSSYGREGGYSRGGDRNSGERSYGREGGYSRGGERSYGRSEEGGW